ncbi:MAG: hypothetical protein QW356_04615 [Candidatus Hadarchaeales archaeon]
MTFTPFDKISEIIEKRVQERMGPIVEKLNAVLEEQKRTNELLTSIGETLKRLEGLKRRQLKEAGEGG